MIVHEIKADLARQGCSKIIHLTQGDTDSHLIRFKITKNRRRWKPPTGLQVLVHYSNIYGSGGTYDTLPDDSPAWSIVEHDLCVMLVPETMALPGSVHMVVTLLCGEESLSAFHIWLMVDGLASSTSPVLANYSNITEFLPRPDTAEEGQFFVADRVTDTGKILTVKAADAPSDVNLVPTAAVIQTKDGAEITISDKNGTTTATVTHGRDGITPHIGINGNWFTGNTDTGFKASGEPGHDGKSAFAYAQDGGYSGTEEEFSIKLAAQIPDALKNPHPLTINGKIYDGSEPVDVVISGCSGDSGEMVLSDNLFDKSTAVFGQGWHHSSSGPYLFDSTEVYYSYVELRGPGTYRTKASVGDLSESYAQRVPLLKADKTWIQNITGIITDTGDLTAWDLEFTVTQDMIDAGACYYTITVHKNNIDTLMMVRNRDYPAEYIPYGYIETGIGPTHADWNAAEGQSGHILNRTHCTEWVTVFPETEVSCIDELYAMDVTHDLQIGETYKLALNGIEYLCTAFNAGDDVPCIGNPAWIEAGTDNGLPFIFIQEVPGGPVYGFDDQCAENVTLMLSAFVYRKLDIRYLPAMFAAVTVNAEEEQNQTTSSRTFSVTTDTTQLTAALLYGLPVFINYRSSSGIVRRIPADVTLFSDISIYIDVGMTANIPMMLRGNCIDMKILVNVNLTD